MDARKMYLTGADVVTVKLKKIKKHMLIPLVDTTVVDVLTQLFLMMLETLLLFQFIKTCMLNFYNTTKQYPTNDIFFKMICIKSLWMYHGMMMCLFPHTWVNMDLKN
jgi:hypothetical protein